MTALWRTANRDLQEDILIEKSTVMVIGIIGENCSGKSTLANEIKNEFCAEVITGKDYLRMAKSERDAASLCAELKGRCGDRKKK